MIVTKLQGGLGNQLFQYAAGLGLAQRRHTTLAFDISTLEGDEPGVTKRQFKLSDFAIEASVATPAQTQVFSSRLSRFLHGARYIKEKGSGFNPSLLEAPSNSYLDGYWQSWKYVEPLGKELRQGIVLRGPMQEYYRALAAQARGTESVAMHIRRQDYVTNPKANAFHGTLDIAYYKEAAKALIAKGVQNPTYFIFSDDIVWCKEHIRLDGPVIFCDPPEPLDTHEMIAMSACRHFIIANSSFGWWGAWLNQNKEKIVVAPAHWVAGMDREKTKDVVPDTWITLEPNYIRD